MSNAPHLRRIGGRTFTFATMIGVALVVIFPFLWVVSIAFKPEQDVFTFPPRLLTDQPTLDNFRALLETNFPRAFLNSMVVAALAVVGNVVFAVAAGYAFARLRFPGKQIAFYAILSTAMVPIGVTMIPLFLMVRGIPFAGGNDWLGIGGTGLLNTHAGLVVPLFIGPLNIFLARQFFVDLPADIGEAARIDGASEFRIFFSIYVPLARPAIATITILTFTGAWEDFLWPLVVTSQLDMQTVQLTLMQFTLGGYVAWGPLMAAAVVVTLPILAVFILNQRHFISGLTAGSIKG